MFGFLKQFIRKKDLLNGNGNLSERFSEIYTKNIFGGKDSRSGEGSTLIQTAEIRRTIPALIQEFGIRTFLDAPCGDWFWMRKTPLGVVQYIGVDIVRILIEKNRRAFGNDSTKFLCLNLVEDPLPQVDLIFCRDCLVHLTFNDIHRVLANFKRSKSTYLLTTTFTDRWDNADLVGKDIWRPLNLELPPFNFPKPFKLINEKCTEYHGQYADKHLGLWLLDSIDQRT
ncbi:MAG: class I SAM-dependent methyltransferase [Methanosarcinales archaeon]|nr:MAG: class I SAM-dependent methyltransferase [Methanosarcinales archaeon]